MFSPIAGDIYVRVTKHGLLGNFLFATKYELVDLGKYPYLGPIVASLSQKFVISANFSATVRSLAKATSRV